MGTAPPFVVSDRPGVPPGAASPFGRAVVIADGLFCVALGAGVAAGAEPLASFLVTGSRSLLAGLGVAVAGWGAALLWGARSDPAPRWLVKLVMGANAAWAGGSALLLASGRLGLSTGGAWAIVGLAGAVAVFAALLFWSLRGG